jgi:virginiamycin B lyase
MYDPATRGWREWTLRAIARARIRCGSTTRTRSGSPNGRSNAIVRFDPVTEKFESFHPNRTGAEVRQMLGRAGEAWGAESGTERLVMIPAR